MNSAPWFPSVEGPLFACAYVPELPAQALVRLRPQLSGKRVAVLGGAPPHERVCAGNRQARVAGLRNGMTRVEAESLGGVHLLRRSPAGEDRARAALLSAAAGFAPAAEPCHTESAAACVLDARGLHRLYPMPRGFLELLQAGLRARGLYASVALSGNFQAALALAKGFAGITVAPPGREREALAALPVAVLAPTDEQAETLLGWGIRTLGELGALPERELAARMGEGGRRLRELARGARPHLFAPEPPAHELREEIEFEAPVRLQQSLLFAVAPILDQLIAGARDRALAVKSVTVALRLDRPRRKPDGKPNRANLHPDGQLPRAPDGQAGGAEPEKENAGPVYRRTVRPALPSGDKRLLLKLLQLDMEAHPAGAPVLAVALEAEAAKTSAVQGGLFAPPLPEPSRLDVTLARLRALVGEERVGAPVLRDTHAPDSFLVAPFRSELPPETDEVGPPAPALRQLRPPAPASVRMEKGEPVRFRYEGAQYRVHTASGPWRSSGGWWSDAGWSHECWDVAAVPFSRASSDHAGAPMEASRLFSIPESRPKAADSQSSRRPFPVYAGAPALLCCRLRLDLGAGQWSVEGVYD